ncbi:polysaccharide lyase family 8 super-sandwich domain-containing protein, partial [Bacillus sp. D-CC]
IYFQIEGTHNQYQTDCFFLKDKIVAMAAGINSKENADTETIVENRRLEKDGSNLLEVENTEVVLDQGILFKVGPRSSLK